MKKIILLILFVLFTFMPVKAQHVDVVYATDDNYVICTLVSIYSILKNNISNSDYTFYILENGITQNNKNLMTKYVNRYNQNIEFIYVDPHKIDKNNKLYGWRVPVLAIARIIIPKILPNNVHKVIYVDGDTIITGDFSELYNYDLKNYPLGMVKDFSESKEKIKFEGKLHGGYYNGGIMLINIDKWNKDKITELLLSDMERNYKNYIKWGLADQDLISYALQGRIRTLPPNWNIQTMTGRPNFDIYYPGMLHFIVDKPWNVPYYSYIDESHRIYFKYWNKSGLRKYKYIALIKVINKELYFHKFRGFLKEIKHLRKIPLNFCLRYFEV